MKKRNEDKLMAAAFSIMLSGLLSILNILMTWEYADIRLYPILTAITIWFSIICAVTSGKEE